jgi:hypothetical protein
MAGKLDASTQQAHGTISTELRKVKQGVVITLQNFPSSSQERAAHWINVLGKKSESLKAAAGGYMIEDIVSAEFRGVPGYTAQHVMPGARPDFLIEAEAKGQKARGVVDITSLKQAGHIWDKKFQQASFQYVAEAVYPPLPFDGLLGTVKLDPLSVQQVQAMQLKHANELFAHHIFALWQSFDLYSASKPGAAKIRAMLTPMKKVTDEARVNPQAIADIDKEIRAFNATNKTDVDLVIEVVEMIRAKYGLEGFPPNWVGPKEVQEEKTRDVAPTSSSVPAPLRTPEPPTNWAPWLIAVGVVGTVLGVIATYMNMG